MNLDISRTSSFVIERTVILLLKNQTQQSKFPQKWHCPLRTNNVFSLQPRPSLLIGRTHFFRRRRAQWNNTHEKQLRVIQSTDFPQKTVFRERTRSGIFLYALLLFLNSITQYGCSSKKMFIVGDSFFAANVSFPSLLHACVYICEILERAGTLF